MRKRVRTLFKSGFYQKRFLKPKQWQIKECTGASNLLYLCPLGLTLRFSKMQIGLQLILKQNDTIYYAYSFIISLSHGTKWFKIWFDIKSKVALIICSLSIFISIKKLQSVFESCLFSKNNVQPLIFATCIQERPLI